MNPDSIKVWLEKRKTNGVLLNVGVGLSGLLLGLIVVFFTFWFSYAVIWFGWYGVSAISDLISGKRLYLSHGWRLAGSTVFIGLLFIQHFRTSRWHWGNIPEGDYNVPAGLASHAGVGGAMAVLLAHPGASANMIADILLAGPRLVTGAFNMILAGFKLRKLDVNACAKLLVFLNARAGAVPYAELTEAGWEPWFEQLRQIDGVQFLNKGIVISSNLRLELQQSV